MHNRIWGYQEWFLNSLVKKTFRLNYFEDITNVWFHLRSNPFDSKKDVDALKSKLQLSLNPDLNHEQDQFNHKEKSPSSVKDVKDIILASSKSILGKVLSPSKEKYSMSKDKVRTKMRVVSGPGARKYRFICPFKTVFSLVKYVDNFSPAFLEIQV